MEMSERIENLEGAVAKLIDVVKPSRPSMPPEIASAIVSVMAKITPLSKDSTNKFQKYDYVSVDQFYDLVGRLMSEAGIFTLLYEKSMTVGERTTTDDYGKVKTSVWLSAVYDVWVYHKSGAAFGPVERSISVPASGAQSYASAVSFVEKYYLRSLFKIPTGDGDADGEEKRNLPASNGKRRDWLRDATGQDYRGDEPERVDAAASKTYYLAQAERQWSTIGAREGMTKWWDEHKAAMNDIFDGKDDPVYVELKTKYAAHGAKLPTAGDIPPNVGEGSAT